MFQIEKYGFDGDQNRMEDINKVHSNYIQQESEDDFNNRDFN